ncbi:MAG: hypothetical protein JST00_26910 [Deltaproteobacteria bacterium]|nr:hypothetical protein [Deltaproteobacteria bacterium]
MRTFQKHLLFASLALPVLAVACASKVERAAFEEKPPGNTPEEVPTSAPTGQTTQSTPTPQVPEDAGTDSAVDTCVRTAPSKKCGVAPQCGCTATETCDVQDSAGNVACITAGKGAMGVPCATSAGCARGLTCVFGTCHELCGNPGGKCTTPKTSDCLQVKSTGGAAVPNLAVCLVACDLRDPNACGGTTAVGTGVCMVDDKGVTDCQEGGTRTLGQTCSPTDDCGPALVCVTSGGSSTCRKWCRVGTNDCGGATVCGGFSTKVMVGTTEYGACP